MIFIGTKIKKMKTMKKQKIENQKSKSYESIQNNEESEETFDLETPPGQNLRKSAPSENSEIGKHLKVFQ